MNQNNRKCTMVGHQDEHVSVLCSLSECELSRWLCSNCLLDEIHRHGRNNNKHLKSKNQILEYFEEKLKEFQNQKEKKGKVLQQLQRMTQQLQILMKIVQELQEELVKVVGDYEIQAPIAELLNIQKLMKENFFNTNNDQINQVIRFSPKQMEKNININYIQLILDKFPSIYQNLNQDFLKFQQSYLEAYNDRKNYELKSIGHQNNRENRKIFSFVQISPNEQHLAIADNQGTLALNNLGNYQQFAKTTFDKCVYQCQFSEDS